VRHCLPYLVSSAICLLCACATAQAQNIDDLKQIATQAAQQYGIPTDVFLQQIQAESGFNPTIGCNTSGACGIAQFTGPTAADLGVDVNDATSSLYGAARYDAQLLAKTGSLVGALTSYSGGCTPTNPCNPAYSQAFQLAQDHDSGNAASGAGGSTLTAGSPTSPPTGATSASAQPFQWIYQQVIQTMAGQIDASIQTVEAITSGPATAVLALAIAIMGIMTLFGNMDMPVFISFAIRAAVVMAFVQVGNTYYTDWVATLVADLPNYFAQAFSLTGTGGSPAQLFDGVMNGWIADALSVWHSSPWSFKAVFIGVALAFLTILIVIPALVAMFTVFLVSTFLLDVMLTIGPLMIIGLLFRTTHRFLHGYVNVLVTGIIFALVVDIVLGIFSSVLSQVMANFSPSGSPDTDLPGLFGLAITMLITGFSMARLPRLVEAIGGGVAVAMDSAGRFVAGGAVVDAGTAVARKVI
jgi:hypothetical protein